MTELTFDVPGVSCAHCVSAITEETKSAGVDAVEVDLVTKRVYVAFDADKLDEQDVVDAITEAGYDVAGKHEGRQLHAPAIGKQSLKII